VGCEETGKGPGGTDCETCGGRGYVEIEGCPRQVIGWEMTQAINLANYASKGLMPVAGGVMEQSAWFLEMLSTLESDQNKIDSERAERNRRGR